MYNSIKRKKLSGTISLLSVIALSLIYITSGSIIPSANAQLDNCYNLKSQTAFPVLLIHG